MGKLAFALGLFAVSAWAAPQPISSPATIDKVMSFLRDNPQVRTIDELLGFLPQDFRSHYTLMHGSHSLQEASPEAPRAIVYGKDARFVIAFNGDKAQRRYHSLETYQFRDATGRFEFREIEFSDDAPAKVSPVNPPLCLQCHYQDPRPNWEHYSTWPGAFASNDDEFENSDPELKPRLQKFLAKSGNQDRYRHLVKLEESYKPASGYGYSRTSVEHNIVFTHRLTLLNFARIFRHFREGANYDRLKFLMVGTVWCDNFKEFFPEQPSAKMAALLKVLQKRSGESGGALAALGSGLGMDWRSWYTDFVTEESRLSMLTPLNPPQMMTIPMLVDKEIDAFFTRYEDNLYGDQAFRPRGIGDLCQKLSEKSREKLADL